MLSTGEPDRDLLDPLVRAGTHHLVVRLVDGGAVLGPFVSPGVTACLRCTDAHRTVEDPDHVPVTARYVRASRRTRRDGVPDVADPALALAALAWAVRDVAAHLVREGPLDLVADAHARPGSCPPGGAGVASSSGLWMLLDGSCPLVGHDGGMTRSSLALPA